MRHIPVARNLHCAALVLGLIISPPIIMAGPEAPATTLDLTRPVPVAEQMTGVPGSSAGGVGGQPSTARYQLPLKIELVSIDPHPRDVTDRFKVQVQITNLGGTTFLVPASQEGRRIMQYAGRGRRSLDFILLFEDTRTNQKISSVEATSMGSESISKSLFPIPPGGKLKVLFMADMRPIADWFRDSPNGIDLRIGASQSSFEDDRYFIKSRSEPVVSSNCEKLR